MRRFRFDLGLIAAAALGLPLITPFLTGQLPRTADAMFHLHRILSAGLSLENGILYPRWSPHLHAGFGYPLHNFYAPLTHLVGGGLSTFFDFDPIHIYLALQALGVLLAGTGAYLFARQFALVPGALFAAAAYTWAPLRMRELWSQGNIAQLIALGLLAWVFWSLARLASQPG
ncbi:MAG: 6-pyruvoyl-tetrahydropterin synthase-related protein, partial [Anaerolineales bacterium]